MKQFAFHFSGGAKYLIKNQQPPERTHLEFLFRPQHPITREEIWYVEIFIQHAFQFQKTSILDSPLVISPNGQDPKLITSVALSEMDSYLFVPGTLYIDVRIAGEPFGSAGSPALPGSSVISLVQPVPYVDLLNLGCTGYMNSVLQSLFHIPRFRENVFFLRTERPQRYERYSGYLAGSTLPRESVRREPSNGEKVRLSQVTLPRSNVTRGRSCGWY
jgi:hypothetical protein